MFWLNPVRLMIVPSLWNDVNHVLTICPVFKCTVTHADRAVQQECTLPRTIADHTCTCLGLDLFKLFFERILVTCGLCESPVASNRQIRHVRVWGSLAGLGVAC